MTGMKTKRLAIAGLLVGLFVIAALWETNRNKPSDRHKTAVTESAIAVSNLAALLVLPVTGLERLDIARMNLLCAEGLPGAEDLDMTGCLAALDAMAARVRAETARYHNRFERNPAEFENSEGFYRMVIMAVVLAEDFHVQYNPNRIGTAADARSGDSFFADAHDVFLHGLTGDKWQGTSCFSPTASVIAGKFTVRVYVRPHSIRIAGRRAVR